MSSPRILLTGASGYIGGSILANLLESDVPALKNATITCLVRGAERVDILNKKYGSRVEPVVYRDLDDIDRTIEVASGHDIIINTTLGHHPESGTALVRGLAKRKEATGKETYLIHTSGTSNYADQPITEKYVEDDPERVFDDTKDDLYTYEKGRDEKSPYGQRTAELGIIDTGLKTGVKTIVIMSPTIFGKGKGLFNTSSIQIPAYVRGTIANGGGAVIGEGKGVWDHIHIDDLAELYKLVLLNILEKDGAELPFGKEGIIFSENGRHQWMDIAQGVADAAYAAGKIKSKEVKSVSLEEGAKVFVGGDELIAELGLSSNARTKGTVARERLGWKAGHGLEAFKRGFTEEVEALIRKESNQNSLAWRSNFRRGLYQYVIQVIAMEVCRFWHIAFLSSKMYVAKAFLFDSCDSSTNEEQSPGFRCGR